VLQLKNNQELKNLRIMIPRGIRNHNPLNIRRSKDQWKGMAVGVAMAIQENGTTSIDWFAMLKGWEMARSEV
jgi:hypothetical protein